MPARHPALQIDIAEQAARPNITTAHRYPYPNPGIESRCSITIQPFSAACLEDHQAAKRLAEALKSNGWSVWWDPDIPPGEIWDELIEQELANVSDVIVLWSATSIRKQWVKAEATEASQARGILVPAFIENVKPPLAFRQIQAAPLADWRGNRDHAGFQQLLCTIRRLVDSRPQHVCEPGFTTAHNDGMRRGVAPGPSSKRTANTGRAEFSSAQAETSQRRWTLGDRLKVIGAATALLLLGGAIGYAFQRRRKAALQGPSAEIGKQAARPPGCEPPGKRKFFPGPREIGRHD